MCKVISVVNQKGGVGKTTTTVNVGIGLAREGKKVLLIDADPQGSLTASLGYEEPDDLRITLATIMMDVINEEEISLEDGILHHQENVDLLPANIELSALEVTMGNVMSREMIMKEYIDAIRSRYDYILIDCMPSLGMMTINALVSSDSVLIPVQAAYLPVKGLQQLIKTILTVKKRLNRKLAIEGILLTMVDFRTNYARDIRNQLNNGPINQIQMLSIFNNCGPIPLRKSQICWRLMIILFMIYSRKIKWKLLLSIIGNEYQKNLFRTGIKASPGIGQRRTEKKTLFWKMQQLRCLRWHSCLEQPEAQYIQFLIIRSIVIFLNSL